MKGVLLIWSYPLAALLANLILFNFFKPPGGGASIGFLFTIPLILILSFLLTGIHYSLQKVEIKTTILKL
jgi:hypothetical protein